MVSMLILSFSSCSNDELLVGEEQTSKGTLVHMVATANASIDTPDTRTTRPESNNGLDFRWAEGDQLLVTSNTGIKLGVLTLASGIDASQGTFSGEVYIDGDGQEINIFYLGSATNTQTFSGTTFIDDLFTQEGTFESLPQKDFMAAKTTVSLINGQASVNFNIVSQLSFAHYTLNGGTNVSFDGVEVTISGTNLYNEVTFNLANGGKNMKQGSIKAKAHGNDLYIILGPAENVELTFNATVNGKEYAATLPSHTYKENRYFATGVSQGYEVEMQEEGACEWVDLGLPSGTLWADRNLGAATANDFGDYYGFGATTSTLVSTQNSDYFYPNTDGTYSLPKLYFYPFNNHYGDWFSICATIHDAVTIAYNENMQYHIPTPENFNELKLHCSSQVVTWGNGKKAVRWISNKNGAYIDIPLAGYRFATSVKEENQIGRFWLTLYNANEQNKGIKKAYFADMIYESRLDPDFMSTSTIAAGLSIRPVKSK